MNPASPVFTPTLEPEDQARADFYALLARLYSAAPDAKLLAAIATGPEVATEGHDSRGADFAGAWRALASTSAAAVSEQVATNIKSSSSGLVEARSASTVRPTSRVP